MFNKRHSRFGPHSPFSFTQSTDAILKGARRLHIVRPCMTGGMLLVSIDGTVAHKPVSSRYTPAVIISVALGASTSHRSVWRHNVLPCASTVPT